MDERLGLSGVGQVEPLRRIRRHLGVNGTLAGQRVQSGDGDGLGVNVKVTTGRSAGIRETETVRP